MGALPRESRERGGSMGEAGLLACWLEASWAPCSNLALPGVRPLQEPLLRRL